MLHQQVCEVVDAHWSGTPKDPDYQPRKSDRVLLLTLTVRNCPGEDLPILLKQMSKAWDRLAKGKRFTGAMTGWFRALEVTYNREADTYHPHYHVLLMVRGDYFDKKKDHYISQAEWIELWRQAMRVDYAPSVDIRSINGKAGAEMSERTRKALHEVTKYAAKPQDLYKLAPDGAEVPPGVVRFLHDALKGKRLVGWGGTFKHLRAALQLADVDDPNTDLTNAGEVPAGTEPIAILIYGWGIGATRSPNYRLMRRTEVVKEAA